MTRRCRPPPPCRRPRSRARARWRRRPWPRPLARWRSWRRPRNSPRRAPPAIAFAGPRPGFAFKRGAHGVGWADIAARARRYIMPSQQRWYLS
eukprot:scaffold18264_cov67-Phaeocystis_antarctica.AAC.6